MTEVERRGHSTLDTLHLLIGVLGQADGAAAAALRALDVSSDTLRFAASREVRGQSSGDGGSVEVAAATERVLERAHRISAQHSADAVSDLDILLACAQEVETAAGALLEEAGVTASRLWSVYPALRGRPDAQAAAARGSADQGTGPYRPARELADAPDARISRSATDAPPPAVLVRSGVGYDSHRFAEGGPLRLGGISIPADVRLVGHSDGDAVAHAVTDAVLGAAADGDIGELFPDQEPANSGRDSIGMLAVAVERVRARGFAVHQVDVTVIAERPKIAPYRRAMREALAGALGVAPDAVSVKGKTNEGMGWVGRGEGLACIAVATLVPAGRR